MQTKTFTVSSLGGLHARPAAMLVSVAKGFRSQLTITCNNDTVTLKNPIGLLSLGIAQGSEVSITAMGEDEAAAIERITFFFEQELAAL